MTAQENGRWIRFPPAEGQVGGIVFAPVGERLPLVVALHGCNQNAADFALGTRFADLAATEGFAVLFPETRRTLTEARLNPFHCWVWWARANQTRGGEPAEILALADTAAAALGSHVLDLDRLCIAGLSSGAAMAAILSAVYPERFRAAAMHAGVAYKAAEAAIPQLPSWMSGGMGSATDIFAFTPQNMLSLANWGAEAMQALQEGDRDGEAAARQIVAERTQTGLAVPSLVAQGDADEVVDPKNARQLVVQLLQVADLVDNDADDDSVDDRADRRTETVGGTGRYPMETFDFQDAAGRLMVRHVRIGKLGHAWSGGHPAGSYTDSAGPDATRITWDFFKEQLGRPCR